MRSFFLCVIFLLSNIGRGLSTTRTVNINSTNGQNSFDVDILSFDYSKLRAVANLYSFTIEDRETERGTFSVVRLGAGYFDDHGIPALPRIRKLVEIPYGASVSVHVSEVQVQEYDLHDLGIEHRILPAQPSVEKTNPTRTPEFIIDEQFYQKDAFYPETRVVITGVGYIRGYRVAMVDVMPLSYNPKAGRMKVASRIEFELDLDGTDPAATQMGLTRYKSHFFEKTYKDILLNHENLDAISSAGPTLPVGYLIITADSYYQNILPLAQWKEQKGFYTTVTNASEIPGGPTRDNIKAYIDDAYLNWSIPPTFVLLVGDDGDIPAFVGQQTSRVTDHDYSTISGGDYFPDIDVGRFSAGNAADVDAMVEKTINYERNLWNNGSGWTKRAYFMASDDGGYHQVAEGTQIYCMALAREHGMICDSLFAYYGTGTPIATAIDEGRTFAIYSGHGATTFWDAPHFTQTDINGLTNQDMYPWVSSHACVTGDFSVSECYAETWQRAQDKGAVAIWASAPNSFWTEDDTLQRAMFNAFFKDNITYVGGFTNRAKLAIHNAGFSRTEYYYESYNVFGDPSLDIYSFEPEDLTVSYAGILPIGASEFQVNIAQEDAFAALQMEANTLYGAAYSTGGIAVVPLDPVPTTEGAMNVTVMLHNHFTHEGTTVVRVPANITINPDTVFVNTPTLVTITILDDNLDPMPDVRVNVHGWGIDPSLEEMTDTSGQANFNLTAPFGEVLDVWGRQDGATHNLFADSIWVVGAVDFPSANISAQVPEIALADTLSPNWEGVVTAICSENGFTLFAQGCGIDQSLTTSTSTVEMSVTPDMEGNLTAVIAKAGFNVFDEKFLVEVVTGTLSGQVTDASNSQPLQGVKIKGYEAGVDTSLFDPIFTVDTDEFGEYALEGAIVVGAYNVYATHFGFLSYAEEKMLVHGANTWGISLTPAPSGKVFGFVTEATTYAPLEANVSALRSDTNEIIGETVSDPITGNYVLENLPLFTYNLEVTAPHHLPNAESVVLDADSIRADVALELTMGSILVWDPDPNHSSGPVIQNILTTLGYEVEYTTSLNGYRDDLPLYDAVFTCVGIYSNNYKITNASADGDSLAAYLENHQGNLYLEGGDVWYWDPEHDDCFDFRPLFGISCDTDGSGDLDLISGVSNTFTQGMAFSYSGENNYISRLQAVDDGVSIFENNSPAYTCAVANNPTSLGLLYRTVGTNFEFSGLDDSANPSTKADLMTHILDFFDIGFGAKADVNDDDDVNVLDIIRCSNIIMVEPPSPTADEIWRADCNGPGFEGDDNVNVLDVVTIVGVILNQGPNTLAKSPEAVGSIQLVENSRTDKRRFYDIVVHSNVDVAGLQLSIQYDPEKLRPYKQKTGPECEGWRIHQKATDDRISLLLYSINGETVRVGTKTVANVSFELGVDANENSAPELISGILAAKNGFEIMTNLLSNQSTAVPASFGLSQNYPNPFNPRTTIKYQLPKAAQVKLLIYNLLGQKVRTLVDIEKTAGYHKVVWDGVDEMGNLVSSGLYFYYIKAGDFFAVKKMVVTK